MSAANKTTPAGPLLELYDDEVTAAALMNRIAARLAEHPPAGDPDFPEYSINTESPDFPTGIPYRFGQYYHLQRANALYHQVETGPDLAPSPATQVPLLGRLWRFIRAEAHRLVLFYVNRQVSHQAQVNRHLVQTLNELTRQIEEQQRAIQQFEARPDGRQTDPDPAGKADNP